MDSILSVALGLGLRVLINSVTHNLHRASALIGIWEGVVLNHFLVKHRRSVDPYVALGFRLFIDFLFTESILRMTIVVLWTGLGLVFSDLGRDLGKDRRFRRLWRRVRRLVVKPILGILPASSLTRVRPGGSTSSTISRSTLRSTATGSSSTSLRIPLRPSTRPVPGAFDQWSEVSTDIGRVADNESTTSVSHASGSSLSRDISLAPPARSRSTSRPPQRHQPPLTLYPQSVPSRSESEVSQTPYAYPSPQHSHSELSYADELSEPSGQAESNHEDLPHDLHSGLTTPTSNPMIHDLHPDDRPYIHSGLTTPDYQTQPLTSEGLPPVRVAHEALEHTPSRSQLDLPPIPIRPPPQGSTIYAPSEDGHERIAFPEPQLVTIVPDRIPSPGIPSISEIPNIDTAEDAPEAGDIFTKEPIKPDTDTIADPPPRYQSVFVPDDVQSLTGSEPESALTDRPKNAIISRAESLRKDAQAKESLRDALRQKMKDAQKNGLAFEALKYAVELEEAQESAQKLHTQASRRFFHGASAFLLYYLISSLLLMQELPF